ncbi:protein serine/threonine phosphatase [Rippkaea orientalis PCC 8801]|uniref:Protein serine/threonine phosphatase n=1 Tax=Rippkaea orientalis (strain PCC 8801 / RF-1) TaxID=41431 RepID=B7K1A2_RIPO1|nr:serine/threonine phosphatase [Rippkaea orientalis]ACK66297.1 protein serine/threonine phosphatase [Rippkaea orientalis PCC 8801]
MLICPQCHAENPNNSEMCQHCGTSLTHQSCPQCHREAPLDVASCPGCGALIGTTWQVIIAQILSNSEKESSSQATQDIEENLTPECVTLYGDYLDPGQRYRLLARNEETSLYAINNAPFRQCYQGQVLDCQPLQKSVLEVLFADSSQLFAETLDLMASSPEELPLSPWQQMGIPNLASPYFTLKDFSPTIPKVHDAWLEEDREVILLPNRSEWQKLSDLLIHQPLPTLQRIYWLNEILTLWKALSAVHCCQSLLIDHNLRVDEDQSLGLQQLYQDSPENPPSLQDLGKLWQQWLTQSQYCFPEGLIGLVDQLATGKLDNLAQLRLELQDLAEAQQNEPEAEPKAKADAVLEFSETFPEFEEFQGEPIEDSLEDSLLHSEPLDNTGELATDVLPMEVLSVSECGMTDRGRVRPHNEDYFQMKSQIQTEYNNHGKKVCHRGLYIVCDGMGGHAAGEVASKMAVESLKQFFAQHWKDQFPNHETLLKGILLANQTLYQVNQDNSTAGSGRMGTTLVMALVENTKVAIAHVGDSRAYRITRQGGLEQLTVDHEVGQKAIQHGVEPEIAYARPDAYQLTQALGPHDNSCIQPDIRFLDVQEDTLFLLCSDGLSDHDLVENHWETYLSPLLSSKNNIDPGLNKLMTFANRHNGHDNITGILLRIKVQPQISLENW